MNSRFSWATGEEFARLCWEHAELFHHVELPHNIGVLRSRQLFVLKRPVVLVVAKAFRVEANHFTAIVDVPETIAFHQRRGCHSLVGPIVHASGSELFAGVLPEETAPSDSLNAIRTPRSPGCFGITQAFVVGADEDLAARHHRIAVRLRTKRRHPRDVLLRFNIPAYGGIRHRRDHVAVRRSTPHGPIAGAVVGSDDQRRHQEH